MASTATLKISLEALMDLECVICMMVPNVAPIYQCEEGHILCESCHEGWGKERGADTCSTCKVALTGIRCRVAEKMIAWLPSRCTYATGNSDGCPEELIKEELVKHEKICQHRTISCLDRYCKADDIKMKDLPKHVKQHILATGKIQFKRYWFKKLNH
jgi:hypothetical protein